jgi:hypothetical protein
MIGPVASISHDLFEHWDGHTWMLFQGSEGLSPTVGLAATQAISVDASGNAWAAGGKISGFGEAGQPNGSFVERWDGSRWAEMPAPAGHFAVGALLVAGPGDIWATTGAGLGTGAGGYAYSGAPQFVHWNGSTWTVSAPAEGVNEIVARDPTDLWAAGAAGGSNGIEPQPVVEHWDGHLWQTLDTHPPGPVPSPDSEMAGLVSLSVARDRSVVGFASDYPRSPSGASTTPPEKLRNYLWVMCG